METRHKTTATGFKLLRIGFCVVIGMFFSACATDQHNNLNASSLAAPEMNRAFGGSPYPGQSIDASDIEDEELPEMTATEHERLGDVLMQRGNRHMALLQYEKGLEKDPGNIQLEYKKGLTLLLAKQYDDAIAQLRLILKTDNQHAMAYEGIGRAYFHKGELEKAQVYLQAATEKDPKLWRCHNLLGYIHDFKKNHGRALKSYRRALLNNPKEGSIYNNLGVAFSLIGKYRHAVHAYQQAINNGYDDPKVYNNLGVSLSHLGRYEEALDALKKGFGNAQAYNNLGCIYMEQGKLKEAKNCFEKAIELSPSYYVKAGENLQQVRSLLKQTSIHPAS
jgi:tetratricopeptide (TPR) repeat protein